jgi:hypothetical protein
VTLLLILILQMMTILCLTMNIGVRPLIGGVKNMNVLNSLKKEKLCILTYTYWVIQNDCDQVWQLCTKIYVATV